MLDRQSRDDKSTLNVLLEARARHLREAPKIRHEGEAALRRLLVVAQRDTGQSRRVALFLLGLYNGPRFPFDMVELRGLDWELAEDCLLVLRMDAHVMEKEVHCYFENGGKIFESLADRWIPDEYGAHILGNMRAKRREAREIVDWLLANGEQGDVEHIASVLYCEANEIDIWEKLSHADWLDERLWEWLSLRAKSIPNRERISNC